MKFPIVENVLADDRQLELSVMDALNSEPRIIAAHIGVMVASGVVTLTGHVEALPDKRAAELAVGKVSGVKAIAQEIEVQLASAYGANPTRRSKHYRSRAKAPSSNLTSTTAPRTDTTIPI